MNKQVNDRAYGSVITDIGDSYENLERAGRRYF